MNTLCLAPACLGQSTPEKMISSLNYFFFLLLWLIKGKINMMGNLMNGNLIIII